LIAKRHPFKRVDRATSLTSSFIKILLRLMRISSQKNQTLAMKWTRN